MLFTLRLVGFFPMSCSPHGLVLTSDPTFTKHALLFVLSSYLKYSHTSLSRLRPANSRERLILLDRFSNLDLYLATDDINSAIRVAEGRRILSSNQLPRTLNGPPKYRIILLNTVGYVGRDLDQ